MDTVNFSDVIVALLAASFAILLNTIYDSVRDFRRKRLTKRVIELDLLNQIRVLQEMKSDFEELADRFDKKNFAPYTMNAFEDLHFDIYQSISKQELFKVFNDKLVTIVEVYKIIEFLKENTPNLIYRRFTKSQSDHLREKNYDPYHLECRTHDEYVNLVIKRSKLNIQSIDSAIEKVKSLR